MTNLLYNLAILLVIIWAMAFFGFQAGPFIHLLLLIAFIAVIFRVIRGKSI
jgi:hypothetical protein